MIKVEVTHHEDYLKIYFNEIPHLSIYTGDLVGVQFWVESECWYCIEYTFKDRAKIRSQYSSKELWIEIANKIDEHV